MHPDRGAFAFDDYHIGVAYVNSSSLGDGIGG